jgi:hypothetical protein
MKKRDIYKENVHILKGFIRLANITGEDLPPTDIIRKEGGKAVWPDQYQDFFGDFFRRFYKTVFGRAWCAGPYHIPFSDLFLVGASDNLLRDALKRKPDRARMIPQKEMYELYWYTRKLLSALATRSLQSSRFVNVWKEVPEKAPFHPMTDEERGENRTQLNERYLKREEGKGIKLTVTPLPTGVRYLETFRLWMDRTFWIGEQGKIIFDETTGLLPLFLDRLSNAVKGLPADRVRRCAVCSNFFWAYRKDTPACSKTHAATLRKRRERKGEPKYRG